VLSARLAIVLGALAGVVIAWHQPRHPMGWVLLGVAGFFGLLGVASGISRSTTAGITEPGPSEPSPSGSGARVRIRLAHAAKLKISH
jgi:hypothetical protein